MSEQDLLVTLIICALSYGLAQQFILAKMIKYKLWMHFTRYCCYGTLASVLTS